MFTFSKIFRVFVAGIAATSMLTVSSCNNTARGGALGGALGGTLGGLIGNRTGNTAAGVILGTAVGGTAGSAIGNYMDKQAAELDRDLEDAKVERVGEGIKVTFDSGILFGFDKSRLTADAENNVEKMAATLQEYDDTELLIQGYTDSIGTMEYNQKLSEQRAASVANELIKNNVDDDRLKVEGYGEEKPVADNSTEYGRALNRRVEVAIYANEELIEAAKENENLETL